MLVVVSGSPLHGLSIHGPFTTEDQAQAWAEDNLEVNWWVTTTKKV